MRKSGLILAALLVGCGDADPDIGSLSSALSAYCSVNVSGKGVKQMEGDYLAHVVACENGAADTEALKAQAVAARTYAYYKIKLSGSIKDGQSDQVYTCGASPKAKHYQAVTDTSGQVLRYSGVSICAFYVAGAKPSAASCVAKAGDSDPTGTEKYVTYNDGKKGSGIKQSTLGWVNSGNIENRGCMSQNGSHCLSLDGKGYGQILRFYYGADIEIVTAQGSCVTPPPPPDPPDSDPGQRDLHVGVDLGALDQGLDDDLGTSPDNGPDGGSDDGSPPQPSLRSNELTLEGSGCSVGARPGPGDLPLALLLLVGMLGALRVRRQG